MSFIYNSANSKIREFFTKCKNVYSVVHRELNPITCGGLEPRHYFFFWCFHFVFVLYCSLTNCYGVTIDNLEATILIDRNRVTSYVYMS